MNNNEIADIVGEVLKRLDSSLPATATATPASGFVFSDLDQAVAVAQAAQKGFQDLGLKQRETIIAAMRKAGVDNAEPLAQLAVSETGMGRVECKVQKNVLAATKTPGTECLRANAFTGDEGLTLVEYAPFGLVAAITPSTNPTSTIINNAISILAGGNAVIFSPHPASVKSVRETIRLLDDAVATAGGPRGLMLTVDPPSQETTRALLAHPKIQVNLVTGGPAIVKVAMTVGKTCKTIAAGPGNPPVVVDETADISKAAKGIVSGASFDNNVLCTAEKQVIAVGSAHAKLLAAMRQDPRAHELTPAQMDALTKEIIVEGGRGCKDPKLNRKYVGKNATFIAQAIGLNLPASVLLLWSDVANDHPFVWTEQLMPVLPVTSAPTLEAALDLAYESEGENHHTSSMYSTNVENLTRMARRMACSIYVKNAPNYFGLGMGEGYATLSIGTPTGDGLTRATHFVRPMHCCLVGAGRIA
jgi:propionaldehyde dehydrogenase